MTYEVIHKIKLSENFADAVLCGDKCFEIRENDRGYQKYDYVQFQVVDNLRLPVKHPLDECLFQITYVMNGWGIKEGYCVFGITRAYSAEREEEWKKM